MASSASIRSEIYDREERKQQYQAHIRGLNAYERHKKFLKDYVRFYGKDKPTEVKLPVKTDHDTLREGYRFIRSEEDDLNPSWEQRLVKRYYDKLFKEYCIANMSRYKTGQMGLRWRTEKEVMSGKGQFMCGSKQCHEIEGLASYEVNFSYHEAGEHKQALVKLVTCERCTGKLYYKRRKDAERSDSKEKKKQKRKRNRSSSEDDTDEEERRKGKKNKSKLEGGETEGKDDENFDEFMEGMFPGKGDN
ncbi:Folate-sensitive fragile site protein [Hirschfeldia incana]|nr:Folate-sensitive fragile site protein [Hirschfeldia incana]